MARYSTANGLMENLRVLELNLGPMDVDMKVSGSKVSHWEKVSRLTKMVPQNEENGKVVFS